MSTIETRNTSGFPRNAHQHRAAAQKHLALTEAAARFGQMNGWSQTDRGFRVCDIGRQSGDSHRTLDRDVRSLPLVVAATAGAPRLSPNPMGTRPKQKL